MYSGFSVVKFVPAAQLGLVFLVYFLKKNLFQLGHHKSKTWVDRSLFTFGVFVALSLPVTLFLGNSLVDWIRDINRFAKYFLIADLLKKKDRPI